jgi:hypothetical protein
VSGRPTISKAGKPVVISASAVTIKLSNPKRPKLLQLTTIVKAPLILKLFKKIHINFFDFS